MVKKTGCGPARLRKKTTRHHGRSDLLSNPIEYICFATSRNAVQGLNRISYEDTEANVIWATGGDRCLFEKTDWKSFTRQHISGEFHPVELPTAAYVFVVKLDDSAATRARIPYDKYGEMLSGFVVDQDADAAEIMNSEHSIDTLTARIDEVRHNGKKD